MTTLFYIDMLNEVLEQNEVYFLKSLSNKQEKNNSEIENLEKIKNKAIELIKGNNYSQEKAPKELREYIGNSESVLESIELVYKNLRELQNKYLSIEKNLVMILEKLKLNYIYNSSSAEIIELKNMIRDAQIIEENTKKDNEKNYIILNSFIENKPTSTNLTMEKNIKFSNLTLDNIQDNLVLKICERRVELPYTKKEIEDFMKTYPKEYKTVQDVIAKEFMVHISVFNKHPILSRFKEAYYLCRTKEMMPIFESFSYAKNIMFKANINPYIVAAVKSKKQLENYIECLENNKLDDFKYFKIIYEITPLKSAKN